VEGIVMARGQSKNGKPTITIDQGDGKASLYYAGRTDLAGLTAGDKISFTATSFADGKLWGIDQGWKLLYGASKYPPVGSGSQAPIAVPAPSTAPLAAPVAGLTEAERITISNWVAHAIQAGLVKDRADLGAWAIASKEALRLAAKPTFETEIP
jgi:hypothetical protein